jgi:hypothetical protein
LIIAAFLQLMVSAAARAAGRRRQLEDEHTGTEAQALYV